MPKLEIGITGDELVEYVNYFPFFYNVEEYGALHDGVTDDTEAIQDAINAAFAAGGGVVYFPNGTYIIAGNLQNNVGTDLIDHNSQIYIPHSTLEEPVTMPHIKLLGESWCRYGSVGVTLKSTIQGSGVWPSVIGAMGKSGTYGPMNYTIVEIENIKILVEPFADSSGDLGPTMCGINFIYVSHCILRNIRVGLDLTNIQDSVISESHVFGIATGAVQNDHPIVDNVWVVGFYYGLILGEGVLCHKAEIFWCYIGVMFMRANVGLHLGWINILGCRYPLASQQETFYSMTAGATHVTIAHCMLENDATGSRCPDWSVFDDAILDALSYIRGYMDYEMSNGSTTGQMLTKAHGGLNLLVRNVFAPTGYHWTTATRTYNATSSGIVGYNTTTGKLEYFDTSSWHEITVEA